MLALVAAYVFTREFESEQVVSLGWSFILVWAGFALAVITALLALLCKPPSPRDEHRNEHPLMEVTQQ